MKSFSRFSFLMIGLLAAPAALASSLWPADSGQLIAVKGELLSDEYEASGATYHEGYDYVITVDDAGTISAIEADGSGSYNWYLGSYFDLEGVAVKDHDDSLVYLLVEDPDTILEFDLDSGALTGNEWDLTEHVATSSDNQGAEGLTFVNDLAVVGVQEGAEIFFLDLAANGDVNLMRTMTSYSGYSSDISGLHYNRHNERLYVLHDSRDRIVEMTHYGYVLERYQSVGGNEEGIVLHGDCETNSQKAATQFGKYGTLYLADDVTGEVTAYGGYPMSCPNHSGTIEDFDYLEDYGVLRIVYDNGSVQELVMEDEVNAWDNDAEVDVSYSNAHQQKGGWHAVTRDRITVQQDGWSYVFKDGTLHSVSYSKE